MNPRLRAGGGRRRGPRHLQNLHRLRRQCAGGGLRRIQGRRHPCPHPGPERVSLWSTFPHLWKNWRSSLPGSRASAASPPSGWPFIVLGLPMEEAQAFADAIVDAKKSVTLLPRVPKSHRRRPLPHLRLPQAGRDAPSAWWLTPGMWLAIERSREYNGRYHVLHGVHLAHEPCGA